MGYTNSRPTIKWWDPHTNKIKYCASVNFDEQKNKFGKMWPPSSKQMTGINVSTLIIIISDISYHLFIKDDVFGFTVTFSPIVNHIGIIAQYC